MRHVMVTGASSGIGRAVALRAATRFGAGLRLTVVARRADKLSEVVAEAGRSGCDAFAAPADLSRAEEAERAAFEATARFGPVDWLIHCAGAGRWRPLLESEPDEIRAAMEVPALAAAYLSRAVLPGMLARGSGRIGFLTSPASYIVWPNACAYIAARHALRGFAAGLRADLRGQGVGVSEIVLGAVDSPYWENNPGSRERLPPSLPFGMAELTMEQAAETVLMGMEKGRERVTRPWGVRLLVALGLNG